MDSDTKFEEFLLEEYKTLREEIVLHVNHGRQIEIALVLGIGAIYGWAPHENAGEIINLIWWFPPLLAALGAFREWGHRVRIFQIAEYIRKIETHFLKAPAPLGWEHYLVEKRKLSDNVVLGYSQYVYWITLFIATSGIAIWK